MLQILSFEHLCRQLGYLSFMLLLSFYSVDGWILLLFYQQLAQPHTFRFHYKHNHRAMKSQLLTGKLTHVCFERDINHPYNKTASYLGSPTLGRVDTALKHKSIHYLTNNFTMHTVEQVDNSRQPILLHKIELNIQ